MAISIGTKVKVLEGPFKGQEGTVTAILNNKYGLVELSNGAQTQINLDLVRPTAENSKSSDVLSLDKVIDSLVKGGVVINKAESVISDETPQELDKILEELDTVEVVEGADKKVDVTKMF